ncbi:hypothetical protein GA0074695_5473 [Micromonospora viridifaciens]|uniref:Uncharacterized protein n=1 Tax=Micromonospora viridifaciens TaxID=1881 RepID=A0A1C4ZEI3_MICVI|nr:hypothetical protein [Micromonospora viridifaciens]SCF31373.1 hypothetical protein GA0074695_5473 [Micromonospora viridifaciens]
MADMPATARPRSSAARVCTIIAFVFAVIAIFFLPPLFGLVGLILGIVGAVLGDKPLGWWAAAASVAGAVIGIIIAYALLRH